MTSQAELSSAKLNQIPLSQNLTAGTQYHCSIPNFKFHKIIFSEDHLTKISLKRNRMLAQKEEVFQQQDKNIIDKESGLYC